MQVLAAARVPPVEQVPPVRVYGAAIPNPAVVIVPSTADEPPEFVTVNVLVGVFPIMIEP